MANRNLFGEMAYAGIATEVPAHSPGAEVAKLAGLAWSMVDVPLGAIPDLEKNPELDAFSGFPATDVYGRFKRFDDGRAPLPEHFIATIGRRTYPLPNVKVLSAFDGLLAEQRAEWLSVGSFDNGSRVWGQVKLTDDASRFEVRDGDIMEFRPTTINHNDGGGAAGIGLCLTRIVCENTFKMATGEGTLIRLRHSAEVEQKFDMAARIFDEIGRQGGIVEKCRFLATRGNINAAKLQEYIVQVFGMKENAKGELPKQSQDKIAQVVRLFESGTGNVGKTWWDAMNAITEQFTYNEGRTTEGRVDSLWFGTNGTKVDNAFQLALEMAA